MQDFIFFADAAPRPNSGFRYGFFVPGSGIRCYKCPAWVDSLQQAELLALVQVFKIAGYKGWRRVAVGSDSLVARSQVFGLRCGTSLPFQNRILRQLFWWRHWSTVQLAVFMSRRIKTRRIRRAAGCGSLTKRHAGQRQKTDMPCGRGCRDCFSFFGSVADFPGLQASDCRGGGCWTPVSSCLPRWSLWPLLLLMRLEGRNRRWRTVLLLCFK